ncbi:MAG: hypothetical protein FWC50_11310 [Planctomycetaceae bacterium]|nr:hypothetical protein [Planctomycetaceae bacterium]
MKSKLLIAARFSNSLTKTIGGAKMKRLSMCVAALIMGGFLVGYIGCDAAKGKMSQVEKYLKDKTVLDRARGQLADAQKSRKDLQKITNEFTIDSEVALRQIKRLEEEKEKTVEAFTKLQNAAKKAELPKLADATAEDKAKSIQIGTKTFTGDEVYRTLKEYKAQVEKANDAVERERKQSAFLKDRAEKIRSKMSHVDDNIAEMERTIADYELYQKHLAANKKIESLGLSDDKIDELLNTDSILAELRKKTYEADVQFEMEESKTKGADLKQELTSGSSFSITDDDLI